MPHTIVHAQQRLVMIRMLIDLLRIVHKHYAPPDEPFGSRVETLAVGFCVALGTLGEQTVLRRQDRRLHAHSAQHSDAHA
jgi:hypothetical protein